MNVFQKIIEKLEEMKIRYFLTVANTGDERLDIIYESVGNAIDKSIEVVNQVAEGHRNGWKTVVNEEIKNPFANISTVGCVNCEHKDEYIIELEEHNNGWIPCSERLPKIYEDTNTSDVVLVCCSNSCQYMAFWCGDLQWRFCECGTAKEPIHWTNIVAWQPLPEPYKPEGE